MAPIGVLAVLNVFLFAFHGALVAFNVLGWAWRRTRRLNLFTLLLTLASWTLMGLWFGVGYCVLTDLHWRVRAAMGIHDTASSYLALLVRTLTGWAPPATLVNPVAAVIFLAALIASLALNVRDIREKSRRRAQLSESPPRP